MTKLVIIKNPSFINSKSNGFYGNLTTSVQLKQNHIGQYHHVTQISMDKACIFVCA